eukprot:m.110999 g.110999  ORF g.110999 m.110999 type:complete len:796 (-) comp16095_c0_seq1:69-2456(-)
MERYEKVKVIGRGSFGCAVLCKPNDGSQRHCVVKQIQLEGMNRGEREAVQSEVRILSSLGHINIIRLIESFSEDGVLHIVMDYAEMGDLSHAIEKKSAANKRFSEDLVMNWFIQLAMALKYIHDKNILHRDIKSQNVFLTKDGILKLGDFGIARALSTETAFAKTMIGTPYNMSPELCEDRPYDKKSDIWAFGCLLYELLTLRHAFNGKSLPALILKIVKGKFAAIPDTYSQPVRDAVKTMLATRPENRPSIGDILRMPVVRAAMQLVVDSRPHRVKPQAPTPLLEEQHAEQPQAPRQQREPSGLWVVGQSAGQEQANRPKSKRLPPDGRPENSRPKTTSQQASRRASSSSITSTSQNQSSASKPRRPSLESRAKSAAPPGRPPTGRGRTSGRTAASRSRSSASAPSSRTASKEDVLSGTFVIDKPSTPDLRARTPDISSTSSSAASTHLLDDKLTPSAIKAAATKAVESRRQTEKKQERQSAQSRLEHKKAVQQEREEKKEALRRHAQQLRKLKSNVQSKIKRSDLKPTSATPTAAKATRPSSTSPVARSSGKRSPASRPATGKSAKDPAPRSRKSRPASAKNPPCHDDEDTRAQRRAQRDAQQRALKEAIKSGRESVSAAGTSDEIEVEILLSDRMRALFMHEDNVVGNTAAEQAGPDAAGNSARANGPPTLPRTVSQHRMANNLSAVFDEFADVLDHPPEPEQHRPTELASVEESLRSRCAAIRSRFEQLFGEAKFLKLYELMRECGDDDGDDEAMRELIAGELPWEDFVRRMGALIYYEDDLATLLESSNC